jgi:hypothetical protein
MNESDSLNEALRITYKALFPTRNAQFKDFSDEILTLGIHLKNEINLALKTRTVPPANAYGLDIPRTARTKGKKGARE